MLDTSITAKSQDTLGSILMARRYGYLLVKLSPRKYIVVYHLHSSVFLYNLKPTCRLLGRLELHKFHEHTSVDSS